MAGYSPRKLVDKLGIKSGFRLAQIAPPGVAVPVLDELPENVSIVPLEAGNIDFILLFATHRSTLEQQFPNAVGAIKVDGMVWVAWPKMSNSAKLSTDLNGNTVREIGLERGLVDVKVCAIDDTWSGHKFVRRTKDR